MTGIAKLLSTLALLGACTVAIVSVGEPEQRTTPSFARVVEAELDALGHVDPHSLHWANLDAEQVGLSCVDGRDEQGVVGTPGGDAGELLLLLAAAEAEGRAIDTRDTPALIDAWIAEFGSFYLHTDVDALLELGHVLQADPRFDTELRTLVDDHGELDASRLEAWLRSPPAALHEPLLAHLVNPSTVGCGHLRSILEAPDDYAVRPAVAGSVIVGFYRKLWSSPAGVRFVVLHGHHHERAILDVEVDSEHDPQLRHEVPLVSPSNPHDQVFVLQPQAIALIRARAVELLRERDPALDAEAVLARMHSLGAQQLDATLAHLDVHVPIVRVVVDHEASHAIDLQPARD